jgi:hypothetical protein
MDPGQDASPMNTIWRCGIPTTAEPLFVVQRVTFQQIEAITDRLEIGMDILVIW